MSAGPDTAAPSPRDDDGRVRVLVIDDSPLMAKLLSHSLSKQGWHVTPAAGGRQALEIAPTLRPHVAVCDLRMPEMDGMEVMHRLRAIDESLPVILLTGYSDIDTVLDAIHAGAFDFVQKGTDSKTLVGAVSRAIEHVRVVRDNQRLTAEIRAANEELERRVNERTAELSEANRRLEASLEALHKSEARFRSLIRSASDIIAVVGPSGALLYESPAAERILGHPQETRVGISVFDGIHGDDRAIAHAVFAEALKEPGALKTAKLRFVHQDGSERWMEVSLTNLIGEPSVEGIVWNCRNVTERTALEQQLTYDAFHDGLTQLPNRVLFRGQIGDALGVTRRTGEPLSVMFLDLDGFKAINDSLGHAAGDEVLVGVANRLRRCVRKTDVCARLGGDEFAVLSEGVSREDAVELAKRVTTALGEPFLVQGKGVSFGASVGIATSASGGESVDDLLRNADLAMYTAKARDGRGYEVFQPSMHAAMLERMQLGIELRRAVERQEFFVQYQPTVAIQTGKIVGAEALLRWQHPERGVVAPDVFIPLAEETGAIVPLGRWVLREACAEAKRWQQPLPGFTINVNVSPKQLGCAGLVEDVARALSDAGLDPQHLVLEITESFALEEREPVLSALKGLGVKLAIDDFGTGYSSLGYLRRLRVDLIKIHKSFIDGIAGDASEAELARAVIRLGRAMGLQTTAEGIESEAQWASLRTLCCDFGQGYYFSRPIDGAAMAAVLRRGYLGDAERLTPAPEEPARSSSNPAMIGFTPARRCDLLRLKNTPS